MDLYLMQHGQVTTETENPDRPLTDAGQAAVQCIATGGLVKLEPEADRDGFLVARALPPDLT